MANPNVILQWNCCGLLDKRVDLELLISDHSPAVICLQETLLPKDVGGECGDVHVVHPVKGWPIW